MHFQGKSFLKISDFNKKEVEYLIDFAIHLKQLKKNNISHTYLKGQNIALLFEKSSTRTRAAFTVAANDLGAAPEFLGSGDIQLGKKESVSDTAKILGSMFDGLEFRGASQAVVEELAAHAGVPVWNGLTDDWHPTQMIGDFMTIKEEFSTFNGVKLVYSGDGRNNVANSLLVTAALLGADVTIAAPESLFPEESYVSLAKEYAKESGSTVEITSDVKSAVKDANVIYTDVWVSMGEEEHFEERVNTLLPYQVNKALLADVSEKFIFMHCLPAFHDTNTVYGKNVAEEFGIEEMEVTSEVFEADYARQFEQGENRMHSIKAIMAATNGNLFIPDLQ
ncbi:Ornithine carbamoyltransferase, catabolic [Jeotgalicoccus saudimassiliensis]|uniref:Ornithine carbamoyltransferase n=1 Tax=Jeotgalicoccus saudimassiliensis TaxID=1461582 RepID=A0A078M280_9STAP|nr:ornithine carbamoyltransferase [Jeotgalicoccus saudimassiliensis]CDZ98936.1 Ornithine carbamoyltransferase, catabolic [Jeotgalicoccus saudimassiliensis]